VEEVAVAAATVGLRAEALAAERIGRRWRQWEGRVGGTGGGYGIDIEIDSTCVELNNQAKALSM
jgi:hypothetical protein